MGNLINETFSNVPVGIGLMDLSGTCVANSIFVSTMQPQSQKAVLISISFK
jgi:hypothetical protein